MNKTIKATILSICILFLSIVIVPKIFATDNFYVQLDIKEIKIGTKIQFSLDKIIPLYGDYESFFDVYDKDATVGNYILEIYNARKQEQTKYSLSSSRFTYYDTETGGGIIENNSGLINAIVPYDANNLITFIKIDNHGVKTDFMTVPTTQLTQEIAKIPLCKKENENVDIINNKCCSGLIPAPQDDSSYVCVNCGDEKCSQYENYNSCPFDCPNSVIILTTVSANNNLLNQFLKNIFKYSNIFIILGLSVLLILILAVIIILVVAKKRRRKKELQSEDVTNQN